MILPDNSDAVTASTIITGKTVCTDWQDLSSFSSDFQWFVSLSVEPTSDLAFTSDDSTIASIETPDAWPTRLTENTGTGAPNLDSGTIGAVQSTRAYT